MTADMENPSFLLKFPFPSSFERHKLLETELFRFHRESGVTYVQGALISQLTDFLEGLRSYLEKEGLKDNPRIQEIKLNFCNFVKQLIRNMASKSQARVGFLILVMLVVLVDR